MGTRCLALLLCAVCGLSLHAGNARALDDAAAVPRWQPADPADVFEEQITDGGLWGRDGRKNANCKMQIANCKLEWVGGRDFECRPSKLQFAIPFHRDPVHQSEHPPDAWIRLAQNDAPDSRAPLSFKQDVRGFLRGVWRDARGVVRTENMLILGAALAAAIGIRQDLDGQVRDYVAEHPHRWGDASRVIGYLGDAQYQVPILGLVWGASLWRGDSELNDFSHALISAYAINGLSVLAIKGIADTERPDPDWNGGQWGFPSFHVASAFAIAGVVDEYYGWPAAVPAYSLAGLISWTRIDEQDHDLSDVVFGAALGWVIGRSVGGQHRRGDGRVLLIPWSHPLEHAQGVAVDVRY